MSKIFFACSNDIKTISGFANDENSPVESAKDVEYYYSENGYITVKLKAGKLNSFEYPEEYTELKDGVYLEFFDSTGNITSALTSNYAKRFERKKIMEAMHDVEIIDFIEDKKLNTEHLIWDENSRKIYNESFVKITTPDKIIYGDGFETDENFSEYIIKKTRGEILVDRKEK